MYDVIFISYKEKYADQHFAMLKQQSPLAKRMHGIRGIDNAHRSAASISKTAFFWVVDADNVLMPNFDFSFVWSEHDEFYHPDSTRIYKSINSANGLTYGYGGVKLFSKKAVLNSPPMELDFSTKVSPNTIYVDEIASTTFINASAMQAWIAGFRECVKLTVQKSEGKAEVERLQRLTTWQTFTLPNIRNGEECMKGAIAGAAFAQTHIGDMNKLVCINNTEFMEEAYHEHNGIPRC